MSTEYTPVQTWHPTVTCIAAGDYMRPSGVIAGLEDLADNVLVAKTLGDRAATALTPVQLAALTGCVEHQVQLVAVPIGGYTQLLYYQFVIGGKTLTDPWELISVGTPTGTWRRLFFDPSGLVGFCTYGPTYSGDTTPTGRISESKLQGHVRESREIFLSPGYDQANAGTNKLMATLSGNQFTAAATISDIVMGEIGPFWIETGSGAGDTGHLDVELVFGVGGGSETTVVSRQIKIRNSYTNKHFLTVPFRMAVPVAGACKVQIRLTASSLDYLYAESANTYGSPQACGVIRLVRGTVV